MKRTTAEAIVLLVALGGIGLVAACNAISAVGGAIGIGNENGNDNTGGGGDDENVELRDYAVNTNGASGLAVRPSDGAVFAVNVDGLFGPLAEGADLSTMTPIGATNLGTAGIFDQPQTALVLAISDAGEFWIASGCCGTLARVPAEGGDAEAFLGLIEPDPPANIFADTLVVVPAGFDGPQMHPGNLLVGEETDFSRLAAVDVEALTVVVKVDNPAELDEVPLERQAHHLTFGPDATLYSSIADITPDVTGIQTIAEDGRPTPFANTLDLSATAFVVLPDGDLLLRGSFRNENNQNVPGLFFWSVDNEEMIPGVDIEARDLSQNDEMMTGPDGTIYLALPNQDRIVTVIDLR